MPLSPTIICDTYLSLLSLADRVGPRQREIVIAVFELAGERMTRAMALRDLLALADRFPDLPVSRDTLLFTQSTLVRALGEQLMRGVGFDRAVSGLLSLDVGRLFAACHERPLTPEQLEVAASAPVQSETAFVIPRGALRRRVS